MSRFLSQVEVPNAKNDKEAVNLGQVKELIDRHVKHPVKAGTVGELVGVYTDNTLTLNDAIVELDGVALTVGDEILVKDQLDKTQNGAYVIVDCGVRGVPQSYNANPIGTNVTSVTVQLSTFETMLGTSTGSYTFMYDGASWTLDGTNVDINDYGISVVNTNSLTNGDGFTVDYIEEVVGVGGIITRRNDFLKGAHILNNTSIATMEGNTNADIKWTIVSDGTLIVDTANIVFVKECNMTGGSVKLMHSALTLDGVTKDFVLPHNLNLTDPYAYMLIMKDKAGQCVYGIDKPTVGNERNSISISFTNPPDVSEVKFEAYILALE